MTSAHKATVANHAQALSHSGASMSVALEKRVVGAPCPHALGYRKAGGDSSNQDPVSDVSWCIRGVGENTNQEPVSDTSWGIGEGGWRKYELVAILGYSGVGILGYW